MPTCRLCGASFPTWTIIGGQRKNLQGRSYCLSCSPYKAHNTRKLESEKVEGSEGPFRWERRSQTCKRCGAPFPTWTTIGGKNKSLLGRRYCLSCSPFQPRDTRKLEGQRTDKNAKYRRWQKKARTARKRAFVERLGGRCRICGYDKDCPAAYAFHHADPATKRFNVSARGLLRNWEEILEEVDKCVLLCCRCHAEVHSGLHREFEIFKRTDSSAGRAKD